MPDLIDGADQERAPIGTAELQPLAFIPGTEDDDELVGTPEDDLIKGFGGNDDVRGLAGNDEIHGGPGNDVLRGGPGNDTIYGGLDDDVIRGGEGNDALYGGDGDDLIQGLAGNDLIVGGPGNDELRGAGGDDVIRGGPGNDQIFGGGGNDQLFGGAGDDVIEGRDGDDLIVGGDGADELHGGAGNDVIRGGPGNDLLIGGQGDDELRGNQGNDILDGKRGADTMFGGGGADTFRFTVFDQVFNRIEDFDPDEGDRLDIREIVTFQPGDDVDEFVLLEQFPEGTRVSIDPNGPMGGVNFIPLVGLFGTQVESLTLAQLGLGGGFVTERTIASTTADGTPGDGVSFTPALSEDGQFLTFSSSSTNFVDDDEVFDIFVKDLQTGAIERVSQTAAGTGGDGDSFFPAISADGDRVAFDSDADNLPGDLNPGNRDVFVADRSDGSLQFASILNNQFANLASLSGDGTLVAFQGTATGDAGTDDPAPVETITQRIFVRDLTDDSLFEASTAANGDFADDASVFSAISANGEFVAFDSLATNLVDEDNNAGFDIFVKSVEGGAQGAIQLASTDADGNQAPGSNSRAPDISADGRYVAFHTDAAFVDADTNGTTDVYRKDLLTGDIVLVSRDGDTIGNGESLSAAISDDGNLVAFRSAASNLVDGDDNGVHDIFVKNIETGEILRFEVDGDTSDVAIPQGIVTLRPSLSGDGTTVAFSDEVEITGAGGIGASQVAVAPVDFGAGIAAADTGMALESMLAPDEVAAV